VPIDLTWNGVPAEPKDDERRRYYRLTPKDREVVCAKAERMGDVLSIALSRGLLRGMRPVWRKRHPEAVLTKGSIG